MSSLRRLILPALLASALLFPAASPAAEPTPSPGAAQPIVKGNRIVDATTGKAFVPHGVNFPGFEYACQQGWNYGEKGTWPEEVDSTVAAIAAWKVNTVRVPLNQDCWLGEDGLPAGGLTMDGYRQAVERFVNALGAAGIVTVLDLHWSGPDGVVADGLRPMPDNRSPVFWTSVATRFKANQSVIFDLFNEPHSRWGSDNTKVFGLGWDCWSAGGCQAPAEPDTAPKSGLSWYTATGMKTLVSVVREAGATQPILLSGIDYANDLRGWLAAKPTDDQLIAGFHNYPGQRCRTITCWDREIAPVAAKVPVLAAEFGQNDCGSPTHVRQFMNWADEQGIGYLAWAWWALPEEGCHNFALVSDLDGTPLAPVGTLLRQHLADLDKPDIQPGVGTPTAGPKEVLTVKRHRSRLAIRSLNWSGKTLSMRFGINPVASFPIQVKIRLARDRDASVAPRTNVRLIRKRVPVTGATAQLQVQIPSGLKPKLVIAAYPGDQRLRPITVRQAVPSPTASASRSRG